MSAATPTGELPEPVSDEYRRSKGKRTATDARRRSAQQGGDRVHAVGRVLWTSHEAGLRR